MTVWDLLLTVYIALIDRIYEKLTEVERDEILLALKHEASTVKQELPQFEKILKLTSAADRGAAVDVLHDLGTN